jgi:hypothetical protein
VEKQGETALETFVYSPFSHLVRLPAQEIFIEISSLVLILTTGLSLNIPQLVHWALQQSRPAGVEL